MTLRDVHICESALRDGLQLVSAVLATQSKLALVDSLARTGIAEIEATSFVPPKLLPQFADAGEIVAHALTHDGWSVAALAPNVKGAERAIGAGAEIINFVASVSQGHSLSNVRRRPEEQAAAAQEIRALIEARPAEDRPRLSVAVATAFGCSIDGVVPIAEVCRIAVTIMQARPDEIILADTVGYADPLLVRKVVREVGSAIGHAVPLRLHLHDTMGTGLANVLAGLEVGVTRFDAALGGLGGCPFAPGASGNIATEDLVFMLEQMGLRTGIDLPQLVEASNLLARMLPGERLRSHVREAGIPRVYGVAA